MTYHLELGNGVQALVSPSIYEQTKDYVWTLRYGKPHLAPGQPDWQWHPALHRFVADACDPSEKVIFLNDWWLDCNDENVFKGSQADCYAIRRAYPAPWPERRFSNYKGVTWDSKVRAWTLYRPGTKKPGENQPYFAEEIDAARYHDKLLKDNLWRQLEAGTFKWRQFDQVTTRLNFPVERDLWRAMA